MKRIIIILCLCLAVCTSFGKKVVVIEVNKEGNSWQNLFNCYERVTTTYLGDHNGITQVSLNCEGGGFNWCRASREIGSNCYDTQGTEVLSNPAIIAAVNALIEQSEQATTRGVKAGTNSRKVSVNDGQSSTLFFIKATWQYEARNYSRGHMEITIETDDSNMLRTSSR